MTTDADWPALVAALAVAERAGGTIGIAARGPQGQRFAWHGARRFRTASTVRVPLMVELLRGVDRGLFTLDESHTFTDADKVPGSGVLLALHTGPTLRARHQTTFLSVQSELAFHQGKRRTKQEGYSLTDPNLRRSSSP